jgi:aminoglycoside/choline kinase family phosphotransferase
MTTYASLPKHPLPPSESHFTPDREPLLRDWLDEVLEESVVSLEAASEDASFRRYFRVITSTGQTYIAMDAPPQKEDCRPFLEVGALLTALKLNVPHVYAQNLTDGFLLLDDFGSTSYLDALSSDSADRLYGDAMQVLEQLHTAPTDLLETLPSYDATLLMSEMALFTDWLVEKLLGLTLSASIKQELNDVFLFLRDAALAQPQVLVHRDFHSRNLMLLSENNPGVIDFQDAVRGPITYDLVSLLRDCYIAWPPEQVLAWVTAYASRPALQALLQSLSSEGWIRAFDLMGVQRHLKASGIFARLWLRDGKSGYLRDIPRTLNYIRAIAPAYPELKPLQELLSNSLSEAVVAKLSLVEEGS